MISTKKLLYKAVQKIAALASTVSTTSESVTTLSGTVGELSTDITTLQSDITALKIDYIVAQGTDLASGWTYRKWNSGIAEAWYSYSMGTSIHVEYADSNNGGFDTGSSSTRATVTPSDFPTGLFNDTPMVDCSIRGRDMSLMAVPIVTASSTSVGEWYGHKNTKNTQDRAKVFQFHCIGTWK